MHRLLSAFGSGEQLHTPFPQPAVRLRPKASLGQSHCALVSIYVSWIPCLTRICVLRLCSPGAVSTIPAARAGVGRVTLMKETRVPRRPPFRFRPWRVAAFPLICSWRFDSARRLPWDKAATYVSWIPCLVRICAPSYWAYRATVFYFTGFLAAARADVGWSVLLRSKSFAPASFPFPALVGGCNSPHSCSWRSDSARRLSSGHTRIHWNTSRSIPAPSSGQR